jgi:hypothetical protein
VLACEDFVLEGAVVTVVSGRAGAAGFAAFAGRFATGRFVTACFVTGRFAVVFFVTARFGILFFAAAFLGAFVEGCFLAARLAGFLAVFLDFFGARAFVVVFAPVFPRLLIVRGPAFLLRAFAATTRRCLRGFMRDFFAVFFLAGATTKSL